jgi:hypothetical protein
LGARQERSKIREPITTACTLKNRERFAAHLEFVEILGLHRFERACDARLLLLANELRLFSAKENRPCIDS